MEKMPPKISKKQRFAGIFEIFTKANPNPQTELEFNNPFELLIAVILSAQTTDIQVNKVTQILFAKAPQPEDLARLEVASIEQIISSIGLYKNKAKNIKATATILAEKYQGNIPKSQEELVALPGVGRKTANVVLNSLYGDSLIAVDTHVARVSNRLGLATSSNVLIIEQQLYKNIPKTFIPKAHHHLVLHGRYICTARKPLCGNCLIAEYCPSRSSFGA